MSDASDRDARLYEALAVYYEASNPDRAAVLAAYPELADALAEHFAEQDRLSAMAAPLRPVPPGQELTRPLTAECNHELPIIGDAVRYFGDYELIREVARGGMGVVFEARASQPKSARRSQDDSHRHSRLGGRPSPFSSRSGSGRESRSCPHRADLRSGRACGIQLLQHEADSGRQSGDASGWLRRPPARCCAGGRERCPSCSSRPSARDLASRFEAVERAS